MLRSRKAGAQRPDSWMPGHPGQRGRREHGHPEAAVGGEALLRREVVGVHLAGVEPQAAGAGRGVHGDQGVAGALRPAQVHHHAGGGLVVRQGVQVDLGVGAGPRVGAGGGLDDLRRRQVGRGGRGLGEFGGKLPEAEVLAPLSDQAEGGGVPEGGGAAVAEHHLVAVGQAPQLGQPGAQPADQGLHRRLAVAGARAGSQPGRLQGGHGLGADLGRTGAEAAVGGEQGRRGSGYRAGWGWSL